MSRRTWLFSRIRWPTTRTATSARWDTETPSPGTLSCTSTPGSSGWVTYVVVVDSERCRIETYRYCFGVFDCCRDQIGPMRRSCPSGHELTGASPTTSWPVSSGESPCSSWLVLQGIAGHSQAQPCSEAERRCCSFFTSEAQSWKDPVRLELWPGLLWCDTRIYCKNIVIVSCDLLLSCASDMMFVPLLFLFF